MTRNMSKGNTQYEKKANRERRAIGALRLDFSSRRANARTNGSIADVDENDDALRIRRGGRVGTTC